MQVLSLFSYLLCVTFLISRKNTLGIYADVTLLSTIDISTQKQLPGKTAEMLKFNREQQMGMTHSRSYLNNKKRMLNMKLLQRGVYTGIKLVTLRWPNPNPIILALEGHDAKHATGINDDCVRTFERMLVENLLPLYLLNLFGRDGWCPSLAKEDCGNWHGLQLVNTDATDCDHRLIITMTFRLGAELTEALSLPAGSLAKTLIDDSHCGHTYFFEDAHDTIELRISDRQKLIDEFSFQQLEGMQARLETVMTALRMMNE